MAGVRIQKLDDCEFYDLGFGVEKKTKNITLLADNICTEKY
jgi:hypothetical protein